MCPGPYHNKGRGWCREIGLSPPVKYFYWPFRGDISFVYHSSFLLCVFAMLSCLCIIALWSLAGKGLTSCLSFVMSYCEFVTFQLVS